MADADFKKMTVAATAVISLAAITLLGIAVITGFKDTGLVDNTTADRFIVGLGVFGTFIGVLALGIVGKMVISLFKAD